MCGRYTLAANDKLLLLKMKLLALPDADYVSYNIAPSQVVLGFRVSRKSGERKASLYRWGLIPFWAKDEKIGYRMINARSETVAEKPSFRNAFKKHRCLIPATGYYEWTRDGKFKQPYYFRLKSENLFAFAGLWERWNSPLGDTIISCSILTTRPNAVQEPIHDRMPVILPAKDYDAWLDPAQDDPGKLKPLLIPYPAREMTCYPVSTLVNSPRNDSPELLEEIDL